MRCLHLGPLPLNFVLQPFIFVLFRPSLCLHADAEDNFFVGFVFLFSYYLHEKTTTILPIMIWAHTSANKSQQSLSWALISLRDVGFVSSSLFCRSSYFFLYKVCHKKRRKGCEMMKPTAFLLEKLVRWWQSCPGLAVFHRVCLRRELGFSLSTCPSACPWLWEAKTSPCKHSKASWFEGTA